MHSQSSEPKPVRWRRRYVNRSATVMAPNNGNRIPTVITLCGLTYVILKWLKFLGFLKDSGDTAALLEERDLQKNEEQFLYHSVAIHNDTQRRELE